METKRSSFTGKLGFVLAAAGSAVGLGNIWRFPYLAAKYGGGIFLLVYLILTVTFGFALMCAEIAIGRKTGQSAVNAYGVLNKKFRVIGWLGAIVPMIILPYYCVIGGWVIKYGWEFVTGNAAATAATYPDGDKMLSFFDVFIEQHSVEVIGWFLLFLGLTALIVLLGVEKGIEQVSKWMMPVLIALSIGVAVYVMFMPGAMAGVKYYLLPDFSQFSVKTVIAAMGQLFYSMSLAMGIMITYGSYMKKDVSIEQSVRHIEMFDTGVAFLAGLMVIPGVFAFSGGDPAALNKGPGLMFETLPKVFNSFGTPGVVVGAVFFVLVLFAALTSSISLMETVVSIFRDKFGWGRRFTCLLVLLGTIVLGLPSCLGYGLWGSVKIFGMAFLDFFDFISNSLLMPIVALLTCIFVGYVLKPKTIIDEIALGTKFKSEKLFVVMIKYVAPVCIVLILISSVLDVLSTMIPALSIFGI